MQVPRPTQARNQVRYEAYYIIVGLRPIIPSVLFFYIYLLNILIVEPI
jgi:hypothetical protein